MSDKLHFEDLTQITCPFGMLDDDTQERLRACGETQYFTTRWQDRGTPIVWDVYLTYRAKPKPKRIVTWVQVGKDNDAVCCESYREANLCLKNYGGYIYRIERDPDGGNPTIELVKVGGRND